MGTTSQTYPSNSLTPTSTLASASSSTPTDNPNDSWDSLSNLFSSSGSPSLLVAFLAIGVFVVVMVGIFGRRRLVRSQGLDHRPIILNRRRKSISLGRRPMLWDVWADLKVPSVEETRWENITPMTATLTFLIVPPVQPPVESPPSIKSLGLGGHKLFRRLRCLASTVKQFYFAHPPPSPPPPPPSPPPEPDEKEGVSPASHTSDEIEWGDTSSLQVSVIIVMPTERRCGSATSGKDVDPERMELGEFCIGAMDVPWSEGG